MNKLASSEVMPGKLAHRTGKLITVCDGIMKRMQAELREKVKPYLKAKEDGTPDISEDGNANFIDAEKKETWRKEVERISEETFEEINLKPLPWAEVVKVKGLTGFDLVALEPFMEGVPEAEAL